MSRPRPTSARNRLARRTALGATGILTGTLALVLPAIPAEAATVASFSPASGVLTVIGDSADNVITIGRTAAGAILVNAGAVPISGGIPTVTTTTTVSAFGLAGADSIRIDELNGPMPRAALFGQSGNDVLTGGAGPDQLFGEAGRDLLFGRGNSDQLFGGDDDDELQGEAGNDELLGEAGNDKLVARSQDGSDRMDGGPGLDVAQAEGSAQSDTVTVAPTSVAGQVRVAGAGFVVDAVAETTQVLGGVGDDRVFGSAGLAGRTTLRLVGGPGGDVMVGGDSDDVLLGQEGVDLLFGDAGADLVEGGSENDRLVGGRGADQVFGDGGEDRMEWSAGDGDDRLDGGTETDVAVVRSGSAPDTVLVTAAPAGRVAVRSPGVFGVDLAAERVEVEGGPANDVLSVGVGLGQLIQVRLDGQDGDDRLDGNDGRQDLAGGLGNDLLFGQAGDDVLDGGAGNDQILGHGGHDVASGGDGDDALHGGPGNDNLDGGAGFDFLRGGPGFDVGFNGEDVQGVP